VLELSTQSFLYHSISFSSSSLRRTPIVVLYKLIA